MLKIDVAKLKEYSTDLNAMVTKYEETAMSIAQEITNAEYAWHDDNSVKFFEEATDYKEKLVSFISDLNQTNKKYKDIVESINRIRKDIVSLSCDQAYRQRDSNAYTNAIDSVNSLKNQLDYLTTYFCTWGEKQAIRNEINRLSSIASNLGNYRTTVDNLFAKLSALENEIKATLSKMTYTKLGLLESLKYVLRW